MEISVGIKFFEIFAQIFLFCLHALDLLENHEIIKNITNKTAITQIKYIHDIAAEKL